MTFKKLAAWSPFLAGLAGLVALWMALDPSHGEADSISDIKDEVGLPDELDDFPCVGPLAWEHFGYTWTIRGNLTSVQDYVAWREKADPERRAALAELLGGIAFDLRVKDDTIEREGWSETLAFGTRRYQLRISLNGRRFELVSLSR